MTMTEYEFNLVFKLNDSEDPEQHLDALLEAGCDDATIGFGRKGRIALDFIREAEDMLSAIISAIQDVRTAIPHAKVERANPDLLNITELAFEFGLGKENMRKYARDQSAKKTPFPSPYIEGNKSTYWRASEVAQWLIEQGVIDIDEHIVETLIVIQMLNLELEKSRIPYPTLQDALENAIEENFRKVA